MGSLGKPTILGGSQRLPGAEFFGEKTAYFFDIPDYLMFGIWVFPKNRETPQKGWWK